MTSSQQEKVAFVEEIGCIYAKFQGNIEGMEYAVYENVEHPEWTDEFLIIHYVGGARTIKCCNGDSISAVNDEIAKYLDHGYYATEYYYADNFENNPKERRID